MAYASPQNVDTFIVQLKKKTLMWQMISLKEKKRTIFKYWEAVKLKGAFTKFYILFKGSNFINGDKYFQLVSLKWQMT